MKGRKHSPEAIAKMRAARLAYWSCPENKSRQTTAIKAGMDDPEISKKISDAAKLSWADPAVFERRSSALRKPHKRRTEASVDPVPAVKEQSTPVIRRICGFTDAEKRLFWKICRGGLPRSEAFAEIMRRRM